MDLAVSTREKTGKNVKALRKQGIIPAVLYGHGIETKPISVDGKEFRKVFKEAGENTVINLVIEGKKHPALIHEVQHGYVSNTVEHIDFYEVRMDEKISAPIPIEFVGEAPAVKAFGGVFTRVMEEIEVEALPADLPQEFTIDISSLTELNQSLYVKDIAVPKAVKVLVDDDTVIATVSEPMKEEEPVAPVDVSAVKVESEEKKEERDKEKQTEETGQ